MTAPIMSVVGSGEDEERLAPASGVAAAYHHWLRYGFAARFAAGKRVLDIAAGDGAGAAALGRVAGEVTAVDASDSAVRRAHRIHRERRNVTFLCATIEDFFRTARTDAYDVVIAFELLEHLREPAQRALMVDVQRVLAPGGVLLVSSADRRAAVHGAPEARFHQRVLDRAELEALLHETFPHVATLQEVAFTGVGLLQPGASSAALARPSWSGARLTGYESGIHGEGEYLLAIASGQPLAEAALQPALLLDPEKRLVAEEIEAARRAMEAARGEERSSVHPLPEDEADVEELRRRLTAMELVAERLALSAGRVQDDVTRLQRLESTLRDTEYALMHLRQMVGVRLILKAKAALERVPRLQRAVRAVTRRLR